MEPLLASHKPPFISKIFFKKLTFGDAPFRVEGIRVDEGQADRVQIEVDFRWAGDANIFMGERARLGSVWGRGAGGKKLHTARQKNAWFR